MIPLSGNIRGSKKDGNDIFQVIAGNSQIAVLHVRWEDQRTLRNLLELSDDLTIYADYLERSNDSRRYIVLMNPLYSRPFPMVMILRYEQEGDEKLIVDAGEDDLDFVRYVINEYLNQSRNYREITLTPDPNRGKDTEKLFTDIVKACSDGTVFEKDKDLADRLLSDPPQEFTLCVSLNYCQADYSLLVDIGHACEKGIIFKRNLEASLKMYEMASAAGSAMAKNDLASLYRSGIGVCKDVFLAVALYEQSAVDDCPDACVNLGNIYEFGELGEPDYDKCFGWYSIAAQELNGKGLFYLADCYHHGYGTKQNYEMAYRLFKALADQDADDGVWFYMGLYSQEGLGGAEQNYGQALYYYQTGANKGDVLCMNQLGVMYGDGYGVNENARTALDFYIKAGESGEPKGWLNAGSLYETGKLGEPDLDKAMECYKKASDLGDKTAEAEFERAGMKAGLFKMS